MTDSTNFRPFLIGLLFCLVFSTCRETDTEEIQGYPRVTDEQLRLELIDTAPHIMTPIGLTIDDQDQLFLLESHTHTPPKDYTGPTFDRIKRGIDRDQDGIPESWEIFADSISDGMNLTAGPDHTIYLACKDMIVAYRDTDRNGKSNRADTLLSMWAGGEIYDHAGIMGITLAPDGWLFVSRGNTGGLHWKMTASDGTTLENYGDGGNVVRLTTEGAQLEEVATGFWNPFAIGFTANGHLMLTDNDPDSRGPNRLVDLVYGGDYGYQSLYGGSGIHPFLAWNGELPGTLPYAAALGEAPCGMIDAGFTNFGSAYRDHTLAAIWEENSIVSIPLGSDGRQAGPSEILVKGDSTFHPVAFTANSRGELFFTDWVVRQYPNHQQGRLWKLSGTGSKPLAQLDQAATSGKGGRWLHRSLDAQSPTALDAALKNGDVFSRAVARKMLAAPEYSDYTLELLQDDDPEIQLQALLIYFHKKDQLSAVRLESFLKSDHLALQQTALKYIAQRSRSDLYEKVQQALPEGYIQPQLFDAYLATIRHLQPDFIEQYQNRSRRLAKQVERKLPDGLLWSILQDPSLPAEIRAATLPQLDLTEVDTAVLLAILKQGEKPVRMAMLRLLTRRSLPGAGEGILKIARNTGADTELRSQALLSLSYQAGSFCAEIADLLAEEDPATEQLALRYLCRCREEPAIQDQINTFLADHSTGADIWQSCGGVPEAASRPADTDAWQSEIDGRGDAEQGKWVFYSRKAQCQNCHMVDKWGSDFGPDLSHIGSSKSKNQLLTAILEPSAEISPEWQGWFVTDADGQTHYGRQIDVGLKNAELLLADGTFVTYEQPRSYGMSPTSLMPDGLEGHLTVGEVNDLISYLISLK